jgi:hypothetical protein
MFSPLKEISELTGHGPVPCSLTLELVPNSTSAEAEIGGEGGDGIALALQPYIFFVESNTS